MNSSGTPAESVSYDPFGKAITQTWSINVKDGYIGQQYDIDTGLNYLNARYYDGNKGRFISQDPVFLDPEGAGKEVFNTFLMDPQSQNSYSYAKNNPITFSDPQGKWTEGQIQGAQYLYDNSPGWRYAMDNPVKTGLAVGVGSGALAYGAAAGISTLSVQYLGGAGTACAALCNQNGQKLVEQGVSNLQQLPRVVTATEKMIEKGPNVGINGINNFLTQAQKGTAYLDNTTNNINIFSKVGDAGKYLRTTLNPEATRIISAGINELHNVVNGIAKGRFTEIISKSK